MENTRIGGPLSSDREPLSPEEWEAILDSANVVIAGDVERGTLRDAFARALLEANAEKATLAARVKELEAERDSLATEIAKYRDHMSKHFPARGSTLGDMTKMEQIVDEAAARFDERPPHRASIEARAELSGKVKLDISDPETRAVWEIAQAARREVASWPAWKTGAVAVGDAVEDLRLALAERDAALRELERWRHGVTIEGDFVCPDSLALTEALSRSQSDAAIVEAARRLVSRGIHRRQGHRELMLRNVELLANDIVALTKLAEAVDTAEKETK